MKRKVVGIMLVELVWGVAMNMGFGMEWRLLVAVCRVRSVVILYTTLQDFLYCHKCVVYAGKIEWKSLKVSLCECKWMCMSVVFGAHMNAIYLFMCGEGVMYYNTSWVMFWVI